ncbi:MAG: PHP domain-containing protein [Rhodocyclaceae bacterium]|nr:PHP domain-containing protein [Rhodocyclaceae bacterium]
MRPANPDLHCHSTASDGVLSPAAVVERAVAHGVDLLALTDHDELSGLAEARAAASSHRLSFLDGVEISVSWGEDHTIHVVGLGIDATNPRLVEGLARVRAGRDSRARRIGEELSRYGIADAYAGALKYVGNPALVSRSHFARYLVECGVAPDVRSVFERWLAKGKPGYVPHVWAELTEAVDWIRAAGGVAVLAHPARYRLASAERHRLYAEFKAVGGVGIEVVSGAQDPSASREIAETCREYGFLASRASDFHGPGESYADLGAIAPLPEGLTPIWSLWR